MGEKRSLDQSQSNRSSSRSLEERQWEAHKSAIQALYVSENRTLQDIRRIMGEEGFLASYAEPWYMYKHGLATNNSQKSTIRTTNKRLGLSKELDK